MSKNIQTSKMYATYPLTNNLANVTGLVLVCSKSSYYNLTSSLQFYGAGSEDDIVAILALNGNRACSGICRASAESAIGNYLCVTLIENHIYLKKGDIISVQAYCNELGGEVNYTKNVTESYLKINEV